MKKLMIAAAIVCAAVMGQAATVNWQVDWAYSNDGESINTYDDGSAVSYWVLNLGTVDSTAGISLDADGNLVKPDDYAIVGTGTIPTFGGGEAKGTIANGDYLALVIFDADNKLYGISGAEQVAGIVEAPPAAGSLAEAFQNDPEGYMVANTALPAPEPTSGLLLLLGVAGLALRRRRA